MTSKLHSQDDWNQHWNQYADAAELNPAQTYRRKLIFSALNLHKSPNPVRILDIGSGQGDFAFDLKSVRSDAEVLGLELSQSGVEISRKKVPTATFIQQNLLESVTPPQEFKEWANFAVCSEVLEHVEEPERLLNHVRPFLAPNAKIVITVPGGPMSAFDKHIGHRKHYDLTSLKKILIGSGFSVEKLSGAGFPFFNLYRMVVIARGKKLIEDVALTPESPHLSFPARAAMTTFDKLFHMNSDHSSLGWQLICVARKLPNK